MRRILFCGLTIVTLALLLAGPSAAAEYGKEDLVGSWNGDVMAMMKASGMMDQMPPGFDYSEILAAMKVVLTFEQDGTVTFYHKGFDGESSDSDHFEVAGVEDNVLTLTSTDEEGKVETVFVTFTDKDNMTMTVDEEGAPPMIFTRAAKGAKAPKSAEADEQE